MTPLIRNSRMKLSQGQIFWREAGQGTALVFLHGSWADSSQWLPIVERLGHQYHCFVPDLLGFGDSEQPDTHYSIDLEVEYLAEYLEALRLRQVYLVGHSLGGWIAASYALKYPDQVQGLVLLAPEGVAVEGTGRRWWWVQWLIKRPPVAFWVMRSLAPVAKLLGLQTSTDRLLQLRRQMLHSPIACQLLFQRRWPEIQAELLQDRLDHLKSPVLVLQAKQDDPRIMAQSQAYAELCPTAELNLLATAEHDLPQALPDVVAQQINEFVGASRLV